MLFIFVKITRVKVKKNRSPILQVEIKIMQFKIKSRLICVSKWRWLKYVAFYLLETNFSAHRVKRNSSIFRSTINVSNQERQPCRSKYSVRHFFTVGLWCGTRYNLILHVLIRKKAIITKSRHFSPKIFAKFSQATKIIKNFKKKYEHVRWHLWLSVSVFAQM